MITLVAVAGAMPQRNIADLPGSAVLAIGFENRMSRPCRIGRHGRTPKEGNAPAAVAIPRKEVTLMDLKGADLFSFLAQLEERAKELLVMQGATSRPRALIDSSARVVWRWMKAEVKDWLDGQARAMQNPEENAEDETTEGIPI